MDSLRLAPHLVPKPLWEVSAYRRLSRSEWNAVRKDALAAADNRCSICNADGQGLTCHEEWEYQEEQAVAEMTGFMIVCRDCSGVIHFGRTMKAGYREQALQHMCRVNGISEADAGRAVRTAFDVWKRQSRLPLWTVRVRPQLLERYPALAKLVGA